MNQERRSQTSIGARMRDEDPARTHGWGAWATGQYPVVPGPSSPTGGARKVLVVGESAPVRAARQEALSTFKVEIVEAAAPGDAVRAVRHHDFAMILLDVTGDPGTYELAAQLRAEPRAQGVPVLCVLPAGAGAERVHAAYQAGAVDCLLDAPLDVTILRQKACVYFDMQGTRLALHAAAEHAQAQKHEVERLTAELAGHKANLARQATHDALTGLPNALLLEDRTDGALKRARRNRQHVALGVVDIDGFRKINEQLGFNAGDELITLIGRRLLESVRVSDTVARIGADQFAVVLEGLHNAAAADYLAHKMARAVGQACTLLADPHGTPVQVLPRASIGIAVFPDHAREREELATAAGMTLDQAKAAGGGVRVYSGEVLVGGDTGKGRVKDIRKP